MPANDVNKKRMTGVIHLFTTHASPGIATPYLAIPCRAELRLTLPGCATPEPTIPCHVSPYRSTLTCICNYTTGCVNRAQ